MDDETLQSVINRVNRLDNRLQEVENQSRDWIAKIGRVGIIVACIAGILGGVHTSWVLLKLVTGKPNITLIPAAKLDMYWTPEGRRLSFAWVVILDNTGEATGFVEVARAHVESVSPGTTQGVKQLLDDIQVSEKGAPSHALSFSIRPVDTRELEITMASQLTPEAEQAFVKEGLYTLVLEVDVPQPKYQMYCIYLGSSVVKDLRENGYGKFGSSDSRCTSGDHP